MEREMPVLPNFSLAPFKEHCLQSCNFLAAACSITRYKTYRAHHFWNSPDCEELPWNVSTVNCLSTGKQLNPPNTVLLFELTRLRICSLRALLSVTRSQERGSHFLTEKEICFLHSISHVSFMAGQIISASCTLPFMAAAVLWIYFSFPKERSSVLFFMDYKILL